MSFSPPHLQRDLWVPVCNSRIDMHALQPRKCKYQPPELLHFLLLPASSKPDLALRRPHRLEQPVLLAQAVRQGHALEDRGTVIGAQLELRGYQQLQRVECDGPPTSEMMSSSRCACPTDMPSRPWYSAWTMCTWNWSAERERERSAGQA